MTITLTPPLKWHGGKHYLAPKIIALMPKHTHYVEPYFGGGAVLLAKDPEGVSEVVNDINGDLMNYWGVLASPELFFDFQRAVSCMPFSEKLFEAARGDDDEDEDESPVGQAASFFVLCRQSLAGRMKSFAPLSRTRTRRGMNEQASAWMGAVDGLPEVHARMRRVAVLNQDALKVIKSQDGKATLFYCDPPYMHETRKTTADYAHEMTLAQHIELLGALETIKGRFMLRGYRSNLYDAAALACGWNRHDFDLPNNASSKKEKERKTECVWCNF